MRSTMLKTLVKQIIRKIVWTAKKKTIIQILTSRCRRDGMPEYGRFTSREIEKNNFSGKFKY